jgi:hypothetical protein
MPLLQHGDDEGQTSWHLLCVNTCLHAVPENQNPNAHFIGYTMTFHAVNKEMTNELVGTRQVKPPTKRIPCLSRKSSHGIPDYQKTLPRILHVNKGINQCHLIVTKFSITKFQT